MPSRKTKKAHLKRNNNRTKPQAGKLSEKLIFAIVAVLIVIGVGVFFWKPWQNLTLPFVAKRIDVVKPAMDMTRARQMTIDPAKDNVMQIVTREKVRITLEVPKGALKEKTIVKLIPYSYNPQSKSPSTGVAVGPSSINFEVPVTLSFNFSESSLRNQAPKSAVEKSLRTTGSSQVLQIDAEGKTYTPTLIARGIETDMYLPARILTGGAYVFSLDGNHQVDIAKKSLDRKGMHSLTVMESATVLLFNDQKLNEKETNTTKAAVAKILSKKSPPPLELYAALVLQKKLTNKSISLLNFIVPKAFAYETGEGFFQAACRENGFTVEQYLGYAKAAQLMGYDSIGDSCINKAKNKAAEEAEKVINSGNPEVKSILLALQNLQILGVDEETNLDERLEEKVKEVVTNEAREVANDPNSSVVDAAVEMQKMEAVGADSGPTYEALKNKVNERLEQIEQEVGKTSEEYSREMEQKEKAWEEAAKEVEEEEKRIEEAVNENDIDEEEILMNAAMSQLGIGMLKLFGFEELDKDSLQKKFAEMQAQTEEMASIAYSSCLELRAQGIEMEPGCEEMKSKTDALLQQAEAESYRAVEEIGRMQSQEYETPEYLENNGEFELYFEEDLSPTPEEEYNDVGEYESEFESEEYTDEETSNDSLYDYGPDSQSTDDESLQEDNYSEVEYSEE